MDELKKLIEAQGTAIAELRTKNDERLSAIEKKGGADPVTVEAVKKANEAISALDDKIKEIKTAMNRRVVVDTEGKEIPAEMAEHKAAFVSWMRKGMRGMDEGKLRELETKALSVGSDPDGGFQVTPDTSGRIVKKVFETSPMREICAVQTIGTSELQGQYDLDEATAQWESETVAGSETNTPVMGQWKIQTHTMKARPKATQQLLDDANVNVEAWLADHVARKFARTEAAAFLNGNGVGKPRGILTYAAGTAHKQIQQLVSGTSADILSADNLLKLVYALKAEYRNNGAGFGFSREGIQAVRLIKQDSKYVWTDAFSGGGPGLGMQPAKLFGFPVYELNDLPAFAASSLSGLFGNFSEAYQIVDRAGIRVLRDPYTAEPFVKFITSKRVGGDVVNFEAIKILKLST